MADSQQTYTFITKEQKEAIIEAYMKEHGIYIPDAPKVEHREANTITADIYMSPGYSGAGAPRNNDLDYQTGGDTINNNSPIIHKAIFSEDEFGEIDDSESQKLKDNAFILHSGKTVTFNANRISPTKITGLCRSAKENISYTLRIWRPDGVYDVEVRVGSLVSILTFDGLKFSTVIGKVVTITEEFLPVTLSIYDSKDDVDKLPMLYFIIDNSKDFESRQTKVYATQIVDIQPVNHWYDVSIYGSDIQKIYTDWVTNNRDAISANVEDETNQVTLVPVGELQYIQGSPNIVSENDDYFSKLNSVVVRIVQQFTITGLDGAQHRFMPGDETAMKFALSDNGKYSSLYYMASFFDSNKRYREYSVNVPFNFLKFIVSKPAELIQNLYILLDTGCTTENANIIDLNDDYSNCEIINLQRLPLQLMIKVNSQVAPTYTYEYNQNIPDWLTFRWANNDRIEVLMECCNAYYSIPVWLQKVIKKIYNKNQE